MVTPLDLPFPKSQVENSIRLGLILNWLQVPKNGTVKERSLSSPHYFVESWLSTIYVEADEMTHGNLANLKTFLMTKVGLVRNPLMLSQLFMSRSQQLGERILDYVVDLKNCSLKLTHLKILLLPFYCSDS